MVQVDTWFQADGKLAAQRDWVLTDSVTGASLGRATSTWVIINMQVCGGGWCVVGVGVVVAGGTAVCTAVCAGGGLRRHIAAPCGNLQLLITLVVTDANLALPSLLLLLPLLSQTRRLCKFPEGTRQKCEAFQLRPARHAIPRGATRQKIPDLPLPAAVGGV